MIFDTINNLGLYKGLSQNIAKAINYIESGKLALLDNGKHEIFGTDVFVIVSEYDTKAAEECRPEAHEKYIDIQVILSGEELIGYAPLKKQETTVAYNADSDVVFFKSKTNKVKLMANEFALFFPHDIHQPGIMVKEPSAIKKAVVKIKA